MSPENSIYNLKKQIKVKVRLKVKQQYISNSERQDEKRKILLGKYKNITKWEMGKQAKFSKKTNKYLNN